MPLPSFTIAGTLLDLLGNTALGEIVGNGLGGATPATVTFTSNVPAGNFVTFGGVAYRVDEVTAEINSDGSITRNGDTVLLLANDGGLSVDGVQWQAHVTGMKRFWFNAPTDGGTVNLGSVAPVPGVSLVGLPSLDWNSITGKPVLSLVPTAVKTAAYTAVAADFVPADATAGAFTVTLPNGADKDVLAVKKTDATTNTVTVQRSGSAVFNTAGGPTTLQLTLPGESVWLQYKASTGIWYVLYHGLPPTSLDTRYDARYLGIGDIPAVDQLLDSSGNHVVITRGSSFVDLALAGSDTNIDWYTELKGNSKWRLWMQDPTKHATIRGERVGGGGNLYLEAQSGQVLATGLIRQDATDITKQLIRDLSTVPTGVKRRMMAPVAITSEVSVSNTTTPADIIAMTLAAGALTPGATYKITLGGTIQTQATSGTLTLQPYLGPNAASQAYVLPSGGALGPGSFNFECFVTVRTTGAGGTYITTGSGLWLAGGWPPFYSTNTSTAVVDTTASSPVVKVTAAWQTASATNVLKVETATIEQIV